MKKVVFFTLFLSLFFSSTILKGQINGKSTADVILAAYSAKVFTDKPVSDNDIDLIVKCGMKAPSGRNFQPWKFTVIKNQSIIDMILKNMTQGNILILISGKVKEDGTVDPFDCALATENMYIAAQSIGLGAHIYMTGVSEANSIKREESGIPDGYKAVVILRIGNIDKNVDATSSASVRKKQEEVVNYK